jgi:hypothetical protein
MPSGAAAYAGAVKAKTASTRKNKKQLFFMAFHPLWYVINAAFPIDKTDGNIFINAPPVNVFLQLLTHILTVVSKNIG